MKRTRLSNFLRQRRLIRKLARRSARRSGSETWMYRDHVCTIAMDANSGLFVGGIAGIDHGPTLSAANADELRIAIHDAVDAYLIAGGADRAN